MPMLEIEPTSQRSVAVWPSEVAMLSLRRRTYVVMISKTKQDIAVVTVKRE